MTDTLTEVPSELRPYVDPTATGASAPWKLVTERLRLLEDQFVNRSDIFAIGNPWRGLVPVAPGVPFTEEAKAERFVNGEKPDPDAQRAGRTALLLGHLVGDVARASHVICRKKGGELSPARPARYRVGLYTPEPSGKTKWICLDFDGPGHKAGHVLADPLEAVLQAHGRAYGVGLASHIERSGSGAGFHCWVFFEKPIDALKARRLGLELAPKNAKLADGGVAEPEHNKGIEVFPKGGKNNDVGCQVWAPWFYGSEKGANSFVNVTTSGEVKEIDLCS